MTYELGFDEAALKQLEKLPRDTRRRIFEKLQQTKEHPHHYFDRMINVDAYKLRVGDYRIIADIDDTTIVILVLYVAHRRNVYKRR